MSKTEHKYFIHLCFNGNKYECEARYQVNKHDYVCWEDDFMLDCFDELETKQASHLFLDYGDCDDPIEVTYLYDYSK